MTASPDDHHLASALATEAGACLMALRDRGATGEDLRRLGDARSNVLILDRLAAARPADAVLSEESADGPARLGSPRVWIVDPLDGTREFAEPGRDDWAVHVALVEGGRPVAGAVALPARGLTLGTDRPPVLGPPRPGRPRMVVSRTRPPAAAVVVAERLGADLVPLGSAGAKAMAVVLGEADIYLHSGGQYEWDSAAPVAVAVAAGLHASRADGSPLLYNQASPWLPDLLVCRPEWADRVLSAAA